MTGVPLNSLAQRFAMRARLRRHQLLAAFLANAAEPPTLLDVGGTVEYWASMDLAPGSVRRLVLLNTFGQQAGLPFEVVQGDARDLSRYRDGEFDLVFSNSVIGHVGSFDDQLRMALEVRRVGKCYLVQTPNHGFPIDWRTLVPCFHWLPETAQAWCFERLAVGSYFKARSREEARTWASRVRNIRRRDVSRLFPGGKIINERVAGLTKSFIIHNLQTVELPTKARSQASYRAGAAS
jgi:SAM-dependent methyltransferase